MKLLYNPVFLDHHTGMHPESPRRLSAFNLDYSNTCHDGTPYLKLVHPEAYIQKVKDACPFSAHLDQDTLTSPGSFEAAVFAVGATVEASEQGDFALVRPPGHHAYASKASGFCLFNNIAIATQRLVREGKRVLIFDFDGHLGDGTSDIFYHSDQVMYWSLHQYPAFPGHGFVTELGEGKGAGFTLNVPLPPGSGDDIFWRAIQAYLPVAKAFNPDVVAISAGFDAHQHDLLLDLRLTLPTFYKLGVLIRTHFTRYFATLEGGYNTQYLPAAVYNFLDGINGKEMRFEERETESDFKIWDTFDINLNSGLSRLSKYWNI
jgi:acetoin utilization deacetylase AcuC-like enzyme